MSFGTTAAFLLSQKEVRDTVKRLSKSGIEKLHSKSGLEIRNRMERLYPSLTRERLPDSLAHLEVRKPTRKEISAERQGAKLTTDVAQRLWSEKITPKAWEKASVEERSQMLQKARQIMGQEMLLSPEFRQSLKLDLTGNMEKAGETNGQLIEKNGKLKVENPKIIINADLLKNDDYEGALGTLYHEMIHAMQYDSLSELKPHSDEAKLWRESIGKEIKSPSDIMKDPKENYAYGQEAAFKIAYQAEAYKYPSEAAKKPKEVATEKEVVTSTELHTSKIKEVFQHMPELQYAKWKDLSVEQKMSTLQKFETEIAIIEQRKPMPIRCEVTDKNTRGYYVDTKIVLSSNLLNDGSEEGHKQTLTTLLHEGRHAYQFENLYGHRTEPSDDLFKQWTVNKDYLGYQSAKNALDLKGYYRYFTQPLETDARMFAETAVKKMGL